MDAPPVGEVFILKLAVIWSAYALAPAKAINLFNKDYEPRL
jgi:hypothetical protein